jgi:hypothetical protein
MVFFWCVLGGTTERDDFREVPKEVISRAGERERGLGGHAVGRKTDEHVRRDKNQPMSSSAFVAMS